MYPRRIPDNSPAALFSSNLALIERVIAGVCRRAGVFGADAEDFASIVKVALTIADISGLLRLPQRPLYRRLESLMRRFRDALVANGVEGRDAAELIGDATREMDFGLHERPDDGKSGLARRTNPDGMPHAEESG